MVRTSQHLSAKARILWKRVDGLEAVVVLRPASPEAAATFWSHFWAPGNQDWIDDDLAPAFVGAHGHLSDECNQCAGPGRRELRA